MINKIAGLFAALALVAGVTLAGAQPAMALPIEHAPSHLYTVETPEMAARRAAADCDWSRICMWVDINFTGKRWDFTDSFIVNRPNFSFSLRSSSCGAPNCINNQGSSWVNNLSYNIRLFDDSFCDHLYGLPWYRDIAPGQNATAQGSDWNDRVSAFGWIGRTDGIDC